MFFVYNKDRIISVIIALSTILVLFFIANLIKQNRIKDSIEASTTELKESKLVNGK